MSDFFVKSRTIIVFSFILICCCMNAQGNGCISRYSLPVNLFDREYFHDINYPRNVSVDLARIFHRKLKQRSATALCETLVNMKTNYRPTDEDEWIELKRFGDNRYIIELLDAVHKTAIAMFEDFNTDNRFSSIIENLQPGDIKEIYDHVDIAIYRLLKTNWYGPDHPLIEKMRELKLAYYEGYFYKGLVIDEDTITEPPATTFILFLSYPHLAAATDRFSWNRSREVLDDKNSLYIGLFEMAVTKFGDPHVQYIGSDGAGTSMIVILFHTGTTAIGVTHIDQTANIREVILVLIGRVNDGSEEDEGVLELSMIGGYSDINYQAEDIFYNIMETIHTQNIPVHLKLAYIGRPNTIDIGYNYQVPKVSGVVINLWEGPTIYPAFFEDRGPDYDLRLARILSFNNSVFDIYKSEKGLLTTSPFSYGSYTYNVAAELEKTDGELARQFGFTLGVRDALKFMQKYPVADGAFHRGKERLYKRNTNGTWKRVK